MARGPFEEVVEEDGRTRVHDRYVVSAPLAGRLQPDARHTYGWKRASIYAAFVNALLLLVAMVGAIVLARREL